MPNSMPSRLYSEYPTSIWKPLNWIFLVDFWLQIWRVGHGTSGNPIPRPAPFPLAIANNRILFSLYGSPLIIYHTILKPFIKEPQRVPIIESYTASNVAPNPLYLCFVLHLLNSFSNFFSCLSLLGTWRLDNLSSGWNMLKSTQQFIG